MPKAARRIVSSLRFIWGLFELATRPAPPFCPLWQLPHPRKPVSILRQNGSQVDKSPNKFKRVFSVFPRSLMETNGCAVAWTGGIKRVMGRSPAIGDAGRDYN